MKGRAPAPFWLIARRATSRTEIFTATIGGQRTLPVFGFREEAETFLFLEGLDGAWSPRDSSAGELISLLFGPCAHVDGVVLDPPPEICARRQAKPVERKRFVALLAVKRGPRLSVREERRKVAECPRCGADQEEGQPRRGSPGNVDIVSARARAVLQTPVFPRDFALAVEGRRTLISVSVQTLIPLKDRSHTRKPDYP